MWLLRVPRWNKVLRFLLLTLFLVIAKFLVSFTNFWVQWPVLEDILETRKCPMCFGTELCPLFYNGTIKLSDNFIDIFTNYINVKNVYRATFMDRRAILKKLGHNCELKEFDKQLCNMFNSSCDSGDWEYILDNKNIITKDFLREDVINAVSYEEYTSVVKNFIVCPNAESVALFWETFDINIPFLNIWTMFKLNAEPIILKYLNMDDSTWPVPKYYGACGRTVLMEYAGTPLSSFQFNNYKHRIDISIKLLEMAFIFTFQHPYFRFYLTDVTSDNIVINSDGFPVVIDLENVIVHTKTAPRNNIAANWMENHSSEVIPCDGCFSFSTDEICSHHLSDHNIYSFCTLIKDDILPNNNVKMPDIEEAIQECIRPTRLSDRFHAANLLIAKLNNVLNDKSSKIKKNIRELKEYSKDYL